MVPVAEVPQQDIGPWREALSRLLSDRGHYSEISQLLAHRGVAVRRRPDRRAFRTAAPGNSAPRSHRAATVRERAAARRTLPRQAPASRAPPAPEGPRVRLVPRYTDRVRPAPFLVSARGRRGRRIPDARARRLVALPRASSGPRVAPRGSALREDGSAGGGARRGHRTLAGRTLRIFRAQHGCRRRLRAGAPAARARFAAAHACWWLPPPAPRSSAGTTCRHPRPPRSSCIEELRRLDGIPAEVLDHPAVLRAILPALEADATLYRDYHLFRRRAACLPHPRVGRRRRSQHHARAPGRVGGADHRVVLRSIFPGGHFYLNTARAGFLEALDQSLNPAAV